jgi:hypothetical protein
VSIFVSRNWRTKIARGHADADQSKLQVALTAEVELLKGVPAGASVEGLVIEWKPGSGATPTIRFTGIKVDVSVPGSFIAHAEVDYVTSAEGVQFRGRGAIELSALDVAMDVAVVIGEHRPPPPGESFTFLYLFVDAKLLPTGIPIASTGLSIYGFQGLLAYNMALDLNTSLPVDERYYELFMRAPTGITQNEKWKPAPGRNALGAGLIVGSADKGFALNAKGMLVIELPDLTILLHARVNFLKKKPDLTTSQQGALEALMVYAAGDRALTLDITAQWGMPHVVSVEGHARAFFDFDNPGAWYLEIGRDEDNKRVVAKALEWNGNWLFSAGFWFRVDLHGVVTGVLIEVSMRKSRGGFWVEAKGSARGEMALFWEPTQWEGSLTLAGRIAAGYRGLSVGVSLSGQARARVYRPFDVHVRVEACVEALFWEVCKTFDFDWIRDEPPLLEVPFRRLAAKPRHWTIERDAGPPEQVDTGVVALWPEGGVLAIQPHSVLSLDFTKPILDATTVFNEAVPLPDGGFMTVGERSGWAAAFRLDAVTLTRDPDGVAEDLTVFGTWARETLQPNTTLRLQASHRFGDDGSLSGGYLEGTELDYCAQPTDSRTCISLESMRPGFGWLDEGAIYWWAEQIQIRLRGRYAVVEVTLECPDECGGAKLVTLPIKTTGGGHLVVITEQFGKCRPKELCLQTGHGQWDWHELSVIGGLSTGVEEWTVPAEMRLLPPGQLFELGVQYTALLKHPDGSVTEPLGSGTVITKRFRTTGPPARANALDAYVVSVNPFAGSRPVYTAYDLSLQLVDEYVRYLYSMAGEQLVFRLFDGQGNPIRDADDHELHIPVIDLAQSPQPIGDLVWQEIVVAGIDAGCVTFPERPKESGTVLRLPLEARGITLTPNSQYAAWLVSDARPDVPLHAWGFTTSWFGTFSLLASTNRVVRPTGLLAAPPAGQDFDALARATDVATVGYVDRFTITPCADDVGVHALVIESPEPMAFGTRLTVTVDGTSTTAHANADGTRAFVLPTTGPWPIGTRSVLLRWLRDAGSAVPRVTVDGNSAAEIIVVEVVVEAVS